MLNVIKVRLPKAAAAACAAAALAVALTLPSPVSARTVTDDNGDRVEVPERIERAVVTNIFPMASAVAGYTGRGDVIVGMHPSSWAAAKSGLLGEVFPEALKADHAFMKGASVNLAALMALEPDVVMVSAADRRPHDMLSSKRKYVILAIFVLAAILTPPDVVSQVALGLPMCGLYEIGILVSRCTKARERA